MRYFLMTLGCQMNLSDGERVHAVLKSMGYQEAGSVEEAQLAGIIACSVRQKAIDKVYNQIARWNKIKNRKNLITFISGCILPDDKEQFLKLFDLVFPMSEVNALPQMIRSYGVVTQTSLDQHPALGIPRNEHIQSLWNIVPAYRSTFEAFVPIQNGCDKFCTFCAVPYTRGREVSRPSTDILEEVGRLLRKGYRTITLLGQNVNSYGLDRPGQEIPFAELLRKIGKLTDEEGAACWIYFTSPHPRDMTPEVIDAVASYSCLAKQIHLPLQSGDDRILVKMNRNHSLERYRKVVRMIRERIPGVTLFTDMIAGFAGETEEQHQNSLMAMHEFRFNMAYVAQYSPRPGAASYRWEDDVPREVKKRRMHELNQVLMDSVTGYQMEQVGRNVRVLVTGPSRNTGYMKGLTEGKINIRFKGADQQLTGQITVLRVSGFNGLSLEGELVPVEVGTAL